MPKERDERANVRDREALLAEVRRGFRPTYLFFWGHTAASDRTVGRECLSQWWPAPFVVDGQRYGSAEHFMMAEKARLFGDAATRERILASPSPGAAKKLGREVVGFDEARWVEARFDIVVAGNLGKFGQHEALRRFLLGTKNRVLVEASPADRIWGIGLAEDDSKASNPEQWRGLNVLGFALMEVRRQLRASDEAESTGG